MAQLRIEDDGEAAVQVEKLIYCQYIFIQIH